MEKETCILPAFDLLYVVVLKVWQAEMKLGT
jgi:hypothetical protein